MKLLKNKTFRLLVWATVVSSFGDSLYALAITLSVYQLSGSLAGVAGMWLIRALIRIPCQFVSGVIVDRFNRKKVSIYVYLLSAALMLAFVFTNGKYMLFAYVLIFLLQGMSDVDNMAQMGLMSELIDKKDLTDANNLFSVAGTVIMLVGPGVGGVLYSVSARRCCMRLTRRHFWQRRFSCGGCRMRIRRKRRIRRSLLCFVLQRRGSRRSEKCLLS